MPDTIIWISGASAGIGRALVETVPYDAHVIDISRSGGTPNTEHLPADLSDPLSWSAVEHHFAAKLETFDGDRAVFVHNAGTLHPMGFAGEVDSDAYRTNVLLNAAAPQVLGHGFLKAAWGFEGEAHVVMLTSGAASNPYEGWSSYCAGKAAVDMWVRTAGREQDRRASGTRVIAVTPGAVATAMQEEIRSVNEETFPNVGKFRGLYERGELREPADAARGIWSLLSREVDNGAVIDLRSLE